MQVVFTDSIIRRIYGPPVDRSGLRRRRTNEEIKILLKQRNIVRYIKGQTLALLGHLERMHEERTTKKITPDLKDYLRRNGKMFYKTLKS
jgi:hypothetical protein